MIGNQNYTHERTDAMLNPVAAPLLRIRWRMFAFLFGFGFMAYVQQKSITVAADRIMPDLHVSQFQIGLLEQAFVIGYALFQVPGGVFGQRVGARRAFVAIGLLAFIAMAATAIAPSVFAAQAVFVALLGAQLLLGIAQGAIFPVSAGVFSAWFPPGRWALVQGLQTMGLQLGAAATPPAVAVLMVALGWQSALFWISAPALLLIGVWAWYARNTPATHPGMTAVELAEIGDHRASAVDASVGFARLWHVLSNRNVLLIAFSYLCMNYVFYLLSNWVFLYLIQERHFSVLESGVLASAPPLAAAFGAGLGGVLTNALLPRWGNRWGYRLVPLCALPASGVLLFAAVHAANAYLAVAALAICYLAVELTEASYWGTAMAIGGGDTMAVSGFMNTGGNLGGIVGIPIVGYLSGHQAWNAAFFLGAGFALVSALLWLFIDADRPVPAAG
jgi:ACS family glucarate transporter-like MFS transporter